MVTQNSVQTPYISFFVIRVPQKKDPCRGVVYLTVLCDHPYLISLLFAVLLSLHLVKFVMLLYYLYIVHVSGRVLLLFVHEHCE